jgi:hypothetical protein
MLAVEEGQIPDPLPSSTVRAAGIFNLRGQSLFWYVPVPILSFLPTYRTQETRPKR